MVTVLHVSATDNVGGSGRAAYRIHTGLHACGVRSRMLVGSKATNDPDVAVLRSAPVRVADRVIGKTLDRFGYQYLGYPSTFFLAHHPWFRAADVIQLYNTHGGYFNHLALPLLSRRKPIVWRLSDLWPMTGHCTFDERCGDPRFGGRCQNLTTYPAIPRDTSQALWRAKRWAYARSHLTIVAPTQWMARMVQESPLLGRFPVHVIPNGVDTEVFHPIPKCEARRALDLPDQPTVLFGANDLTEERKGASALREAIARLASNRQGPATLLTIGSGSIAWTPPSPFVLRTLGRIDDDAQLAIAYSAANVFVAPATADQLPNTILESMACGTPVVACAVGGIPEAVIHRETGYLAQPNDSSDIACGIVELCADRAFAGACGERSRERMVRDHALAGQTQRYIDLYTTLGRAGTGYERAQRTPSR